MTYIRPVPVKKEDIKIGKQYYSCWYSGVIKVIVIKIFDDTDCVLVKSKDKNCKLFVRSIKYIFDNSEMAKYAGRNWEHDEKIQKGNK